MVRYLEYALSPHATSEAFLYQRLNEWSSKRDKEADAARFEKICGHELPLVRCDVRSGARRLPPKALVLRRVEWRDGRVEPYFLAPPFLTSLRRPCGTRC